MIAIVATSPPPKIKNKQTNKNETKQNLLPMDDCQFGYKNKFLYKKNSATGVTTPTHKSV
jgi:hypothetical protein